MFDHFFDMMKFDHRFFSSFISLVSKVACPSSLIDFRLIFLLGWIHKLITCVLVARLRGVIGKLVQDSQSAFIKGRNIFYGWTVASEVLDEMRRTGDEMVFKIDFEKAYDCVNWDFLLFALSKMGFEVRWIRWIKRCFSCDWVSLLVNGSAGSEFLMQQGLRWGCPLSLLLFILVTETLPILVNQFENNQWLKGVRIGGLRDRTTVF